MPPTQDRRHERRAAAARARSQAPQPKRPAPSFLRNPAIIASAAVAGVVVIALGAWLIVGRTSSSSSTATGVTPVALPTFGADAPQNVLESTTPDILTPTPGVAGPTAVVVTQGAWQVLVAHSATPDLTSPSGVAVDADGNIFVVDFEGDFVREFSPGGQAIAKFGDK